jgi:hypothetical protein
VHNRVGYTDVDFRETFGKLAPLRETSFQYKPRRRTTVNEKAK